MSDTLIISIVTVLLSAISSMALVNWRLQQIEKRLDTHNGYAEKFAEASKDIAVMQTDIKYIKEKLDEKIDQ